MFFDMREQVRQIIQKFQLITSGQTLVIGVSGGTDSLALLHILHQILPRQGVILHVATLDHQLRGAESAADVRYVEQVCQALGVPLTIGSTDVGALARQRSLGIEAAARVARYDFLASVAHAQGVTRIAVAHHSDDQAETVLMHLLRGSGIHGLAGMALVAPVPGHADLSVIRPLLGISRADIEAYCFENKLVPRQDSTNADTSLLRNAIRLEVLPFLAQYAPHIKPALARLAEIAAVEDSYLQEEVAKFTGSGAVRLSEGQVTLEGKAFFRLHAALQRRVLLWAVARLGQSEDVSAQLVLEAIEIARNGRTDALGLLGGGVQLRVEYDALIVESVGAANPDADFALLVAGSVVVVTIPAKIIVGEWVLEASYSAPQDNRKVCRLVIPVGAQVTLRTRHAGDVFVPLGMNGHSQKVSRWMVNRKIPVAVRDRVPMLIVDNTVAAIYFKDEWFVSELFAVRNNAEPIIYFVFLENS